MRAVKTWLKWILSLNDGKVRRSVTLHWMDRVRQCVKEGSLAGIFVFSHVMVKDVVNINDDVTYRREHPS